MEKQSRGIKIREKGQEKRKATKIRMGQGKNNVLGKGAWERTWVNGP